MVKKVLKGTGFVAYFIFVFVLGVVFGFPDNKISGYIEYQVSRNTPLNLEIGDGSYSPTGSISLKDVSVRLKNGKNKLVIDAVVVDFSPLKYLSGKKIEVEFDLSLLNGSVEDGSFRLSKKGWKFDSGEIKGVRIDNLFKFFIIEENGKRKSKIPLELKGILSSGRIKLSSRKRFKNLESLYYVNGNITLNFDNLIARHIKLGKEGPTSLYFDLYNVHLGTANIEIYIGPSSKIKELKRLPKKSRVVFFKKLEIVGDDVEIILDGASYINIRKNRFNLSTLNLSLLLKINESLYKRKARIDGKLETPNKGLKTLLSLNPKLKLAKSNDFYGIRFVGLIKRPRFSPYKPLIKTELKKKIQTLKKKAKKKKEVKKVFKKKTIKKSPPRIHKGKIKFDHPPKYLKNRKHDRKKPKTKVIDLKKKNEENLKNEDKEGEEEGIEEPAGEGGEEEGLEEGEGAPGEEEGMEEGEGEEDNVEGVKAKEEGENEEGVEGEGEEEGGNDEGIENGEEGEDKGGVGEEGEEEGEEGKGAKEGEEGEDNEEEGEAE